MNLITFKHMYKDDVMHEYTFDKDTYSVIAVKNYREPQEPMDLREGRQYFPGYMRIFFEQYVIEHGRPDYYMICDRFRISGEDMFEMVRAFQGVRDGEYAYWFKFEDQPDAKWEDTLRDVSLKWAGEYCYAD